MVVELKNAAFDLMAAESPFFQNSASQRMAAVATQPETFNNRLGLERGFW
jgi:hypothetical protein